MKDSKCQKTKTISYQECPLRLTFRDDWTVNKILDKHLMNSSLLNKPYMKY